MNVFKFCEIKMKILVVCFQFYIQLLYLKLIQKFICYKIVFYIVLFLILKLCYFVYKLNCQFKNVYDVVYGFVFLFYCIIFIRSVILEIGICGVKVSFIFLYDDIGDDVFEWFFEFGQLI